MHLERHTQVATLVCQFFSVIQAAFPVSYQSRTPYYSVDDRRTSYPPQSSFGNYPNQSPPPLRSYVIYEGDVGSLPNSWDRPQTLGATRSWHLEFNQRNQQQPSPSSPYPAVAYKSVYSNLIQVYDEPSQKNYYGPYDGKTYLEPERNYYNRHVPRPVEVPRYEVVYPYEPTKTVSYYDQALPDKFPNPFSPNKNFEMKDPVVDPPRKDNGFYRVQTVSYPAGTNRASRGDLCNYIRLNEKGFPVGNDMCGRTVSDILLAPDYSTTGELILEHRKRFRGVNQEVETNQVKRQSYGRRRRNVQNDMTSRLTMGSYYPNCCGEVGGTGYGYRPYYGYRDNNNDNVRLMSRPYQGEGGGRYSGYGFRDPNYNYNEADYGEETSDNSGLTSYLANRNRGDRDRFKDNDESDEESRGSKGNKKSNRNDRRRGSSNHTSNDRNSDRRQNGDAQFNNNHRNSGSRPDDSEETYDSGSNRDQYFSRNGGNNYNYLRSHSSGGSSQDYYGGRRGLDNLGGGSYNGGHYGGGYGGYGGGQYGGGGQYNYGRGGSGYGYGG